MSYYISTVGATADRPGNGLSLRGVTAPNRMTAMFNASDLIYSYSRADALADGELVDVSELATSAGFRVPVAMTRAAWADAVEWTDADKARKRGRAFQDERGRLLDVLGMARFAIRANRVSGGSRMLFDVYRVPRDGSGITPRRTRLAIVSGPGDAGEHVLTIMLPDED